MSTGKVHLSLQNTGWIIVLPASILLVYFGVDISLTVLLGYAAGYILEPDLDQISITSSEGRVLRRLGLIGVFWIAYWLPYSFFIPHRSPASHWPVLSDIIRMIYLFGPISAIVWWYVPIENYLHPGHIVYVLAFLGGLSLATSLHWIADTRWFTRRNKIAVRKYHIAY